MLRYADSLRTHGHRAAKIDPLDLLQREDVAALDPARYGLVDMQELYNVDGIIWHKPPQESRHEPSEQFWPLRRIIDHMRTIYVGRIAYEYMHSTSKTERLWFSHHLEATPTQPKSPQDRRRIWQLLAKSEAFDQFLQARFPNLKRYGLEGGESMIPALESLFAAAARGVYIFGALISIFMFIHPIYHIRWRRAYCTCYAPSWSTQPSYRTDPPPIFTYSPLP